MARGPEIPVPLGLVETQAATARARFGAWPPGYEAFAIKHCRGVVPQRVRDLVERLRAARPWAFCAHGTDLDVEWCGRCHGFAAPDA